MRSEYHYKVYYRPYDNGVLKACKALMDWDLFPSMQNVWDIIPYSFVVDWFLDVENALNALDAQTYAATLSVLSTTSSIKRSISFSFSAINRLLGYDIYGLDIESIGQVTVSIYDRFISKNLVLPRARLTFPTEFRNFAELTAIILSKKG